MKIHTYNFQLEISSYIFKFYSSMYIPDNLFIILLNFITLI